MLRRGKNIRVLYIAGLLFGSLVCITISSPLADPLVDTTVAVDPSSVVVGADQSFDVDVGCTPGQPVKSFELKISFDATVLKVNSVSEGDIFGGYSTLFNAGTINNVQGTVINIYGLILGQGNVTGSGSLVMLNCTSLSAGGTSTIGLYDVGVTNESSYVSVVVTNGSVMVDTTPPEISDISPASGTTGDSFVFMVSVTDDTTTAGALTVKVDWSHGILGSNTSMTYVSGSLFQKVVVLDDTTASMGYQFYVIDAYGNSNVSSLDFVTVTDNDLPLIANLIVAPGLQDAGGMVNVSADVTDNIGVGAVFLEIIYPNSGVENISILANQSGDSFYCNMSYTMLGSYSMHLWVEDVSGNGVESSSDSFDIVDALDPTLSDFVRLVSNPLDTDSLFGWVNVSCEAADNVGLAVVSVNISLPQGGYSNLSMNSVVGDEFCYNSSSVFSVIGQYSYCFWAQDLGGNAVQSTDFSFVMPANCDVDADGQVQVMDLVLVSNYYGSSGTAGWIREDVDNNGQITVLDLVSVSNAYGTVYWT